ncbi:unnamed protein product [Alternaria alternata]
MAAFTVDETSAPTSIEDSNHQQNGKAEYTTATNLIDATNLSVQGIVVAAGYPRHLTLDVGGRKFKVSCDTLKSESGWFKRQLSGRFGPWEPELDGSYFMDTDPDLFEYLLRFMRRPEVFPLFYSKMNGFDYDLYNRLQAEALYFQTDTLYEPKSCMSFREHAKFTFVLARSRVTKAILNFAVRHVIRGRRIMR